MKIEQQIDQEQEDIDIKYLMRETVVEPKLNSKPSGSSLDGGDSALS